MSSGSQPSTLFPLWRMMMAAGSMKTMVRHEKARHRRARILLLAAVCGTLLAVALVVVYGSGQARHTSSASVTPSSQSMAVVATVNGITIPVREFELFLAQDRAATFAYFRQKYGAVDSRTFWTTPYGGQTPQAYLKQHALTDAVNTTVQRQLAHGFGILPDATYSEFLQALAAENTRRGLAVKQGQPVYGPVQYTETNYFSYLLEQQVPALQDALVNKGVIVITESALCQFYAAHQGQFRTTSSEAASGTPTTGPGSPPAADSFAQAEPQVRMAYVQQQYDAYLSKAVEAATVTVDQTVLAQIPIN